MMNFNERKEKMKNLLPASLILAAGIALGGFCPGYYYYQTKVNNNTVVVKGLAEMNVKADLAIWKLKFVTTGNELPGAQKNITDQANQIVAFLKEQGFNETEINVERIETNDLMANPYRNGNVTDNTRFILTQTITVKSGKVDLVEQSLPKTNQLIGKGIIFDNSYSDPVSYIFTKLNDIKPKMLKEATINAKKAAAEFAANAGSQVGKIRYANQGVFSILPAEGGSGSYEAQQIDKTVRVVSTVEYRLD